MIEPGIYDNISNEDYHAGPGLSSSNMKLIKQSPAHYKSHKHEDSEALIFGTATHTAVFEWERFKLEYIPRPERINTRTKKGQEELANLESQYIVLKQEAYDRVIGIRDAIFSHDIAAILVTGGVAEQSVYWRQPVLKTGKTVLCKARPDYLIEFEDDDYICIDLKSTKDARPRYFSKDAYWDYGYHISAAHYINGLTAIKGRPPKEFRFIAVEKFPPYGIYVFKATPSFLNAGFEDCEQIYKIFLGCLESGKWPSYLPIVQDLELPRGA